jgi:hypothetical protein
MLFQESSMDVVVTLNFVAFVGATALAALGIERLGRPAGRS